MIFGIEQKYIIEDVTNERVVATKIMFTNQGTDVVFINDVTLLAGD